MLGKVWLIGAGPGEVELITLKGMRCIQFAEVLVYDRLVNPELLDYAPAGCERINVGKSANHHPISQEEIQHILVEQAQKGKRVVRLKSGDPYVFGRGAEEVQALLEAEVSFEVVPGISSAIGGLGCAGIPVTHRDYASSFHVITGHPRTDQDAAAIQWEVLSQLDGTLVVLMGVAVLATICTELMRGGKPASTPVAIVMWASRPEQRVITGTLATIADRAQQEKVSAPALIVVGEVVRFHHPFMGSLTALEALEAPA